MAAPATVSECRTSVAAVADRYGRDRDFVIPMLQDLQARFGCLPPEVLHSLAEAIGVPVSQLYAVATFYTSFSLVPQGRHLITLCTGTVCYLKGAKQIAEMIQSHLNVAPGGTTEDRTFTYRPVNCLGACALGPVLMVDGDYYAKVKPAQVPDILSQYAATEAAGERSE